MVLGPCACKQFNFSFKGQTLVAAACLLLLPPTVGFESEEMILVSGIGCFPIIPIGFSTSMNLLGKISIIFPAVRNASATFK